MGEVFLADDTQLGRKVAIKFLAEALEADETARERLHREARSAAALDHPFVCKIYELADIDGRTGIVMEHVTSETLLSRRLQFPKKLGHPWQSDQLVAGVERGFTLAKLVQPSDKRNQSVFVVVDRSACVDNRSKHFGD